MFGGLFPWYYITLPELTVVKDNYEMEAMLVFKHIDQTKFGNHKIQIQIQMILIIGKWLLVCVLENQHNFHFIVIFHLKFSVF